MRQADFFKTNYLAIALFQALSRSYHYDTIINMNDTITDRQLRILRYLSRADTSSRQDIEGLLHNASRVTIIRDLNQLNSKKLISITGKGRATTYSITDIGKQFRLYDPAIYFQEEPDARRATFTTFIFKHLNKFKNIWSQKQLSKIKKLTAGYRSRRGGDVATRELERFVIEFSWKSSKIEGNTYSLLETEQLLKASVRAIGRSQKETDMIVNHKTTFEYIWQNKQNYCKLSKRLTEEIHQLLTRNLDIHTGLRRLPVGITGTAYTPPSSQIEIRSHLDLIVELINDCSEVLTASLIALVGISYLQPFADGNKRTARLISNALLIAGDYPPVSYRSVDEKAFKEALILFYEQATPDYISKLFMEQFEFSAKNYSL